MTDPVERDTRGYLELGRRQMDDGNHFSCPMLELFGSKK
jgi:hypothetical protein